MSEEINNREYRQKVIKDLIAQLQSGKSVEEVKGQFAKTFEGVSAEEIAQAEQALVADGLPISEVQRLCDVHAAVFKGSIEEIHRPADPSKIPGHPANVLKAENRAVDQLLGEIRSYLPRLPEEDAEKAIKTRFTKLAEIDRHYLKKENLLFPYLEHYGITAPPKVMWGVDDEIRAQIKEISRNLNLRESGQLKEAIEALLNQIAEMIFKEENIMLPMLLENLTEDEWEKVAEESGDFGFCLIEKAPVWKPNQQKGAADRIQEESSLPGTVALPTGTLKIEELIRILDTLPVDLTFVDRDDTVKYFSQGAERVFPRTKAIIGRKVANCHPPASVHIVEKIVEDLKAGRKEHEDFWIKMGGRYIYIRYFAVRNEKKEYLGVLEVTQDIQPIQQITGEKRLMSD
ncbi:hypothetical protein CAFE_05680 [Caprobacter fermentans]|uniref:PAS domain S-box protein n=1 Tax=Caproicibacter fermentans TaxID=2576756 RepID=A0A6N8HW45_9FIRM|nr:DUF438 domain-containing protein [Caproicibacter fermentans]MVB09899.1 hypothetical protein [Caproicibacter fermentans]